MILRVRGYCDVLERNCARLGAARATYVRDLLLTMGIPAARLQAEGLPGDHLYDRAGIENIEDRKEREETLARDRRVDYLVVSMDYAP